MSCGTGDGLYVFEGGFLLILRMYDVGLHELDNVLPGMSKEMDQRRSARYHQGSLHPQHVFDSSLGFVVVRRLFGLLKRGQTIGA